MRKSPLRKIGKIGKRNLAANKILKQIYSAKGIKACEIGLEDCLKTWTLAFAHKNPRSWYYKRPELLSGFNQTLLACVSCHQKIDDKKKLKAAIFNKLRKHYDLQGRR